MQKSSLSRIDGLMRQLDAVKHIAEAGYWVTTEELCLLLDWGVEAIAALDTREPLHSFAWRNFTCTLTAQQQKTNYWRITLNRSRDRDEWDGREDVVRQVTAQLRASQQEAETRAIATGTTAAARNNDTQGISTAVPLAAPPLAERPRDAWPPGSPPGVVPSRYAVVENFLTSAQAQDIYAYALKRQADFQPTTNSANDPSYRQSWFIYDFPEYSRLLIERVRSMMPYILTYLGIPTFEVDSVEAQLTAHNDGNYYKVHNDSGSPDSATRVLTYVYYFHREPKQYSGGELVIYDSKVENGYYVAADTFHAIAPTHNSIVFFPSYYMHEVKPVVCPSRAFADSRFTINGWVRHVAGKRPSF